MFKIFKEQNIKRFEKILAWDNLSSLVLYSKYVLVIIFALMIGRYIRYGFSLINTLPCLIESAIILALMIGAKYILKTVDGNSKQIVIHARIFTTIFSFSTFLLSMFYDIVVKPTNVSVMMYVTLLIISAMFDSYPHDYILFYSFCFVAIVLFEMFFVQPDIFITDTINTVFVILGGSYIVTHRMISKIQPCNGDCKCRVDLQLTSTAAMWDNLLLGGVFCCEISFSMVLLLQCKNFLRFWDILLF